MKKLLQSKKMIAIIIVGLVIISGIIIGIILHKNKNTNIKEITKERVAYFKGTSIVKVTFEEKYQLCDKKICSDIKTNITEIDNINSKNTIDLSDIEIFKIDIYEVLTAIMKLDKEKYPDTTLMLVIYNSPYLDLTKLESIEGVEISGGYIENINEEDVLNDDEDTFIVSFNTIGGSNIPSQRVNNGDKVNKPETPTKDGYEFANWQLDGKSYDFDTEVTSNIVLTATWKKVETKTNTSKTNNKSSQTEKENKSKEENSTSKSANNSQINYKADLENDDHRCFRSGLTYYFDSNGGSYIPPVKVEPEKVVSFAGPERPGYIFTGWYLDGKPFYPQANDCTNNELTLVAHWEEIPKKTITFDSNGGNSVSTQYVKISFKVAKPKDPVRDCYTFDGWYDENKVKYDFDKETVYRDLTLTARWSSLKNVNPYSVRAYYAKGPDVIEPEVTVYTSAWYFTDDYGLKWLPSHYYVEGYTFEGWYEDAAYTKKITGIEALCKDKTLYAKWIPNN